MFVKKRWPPLFPSAVGNGRTWRRILGHKESKVSLFSPLCPPDQLCCVFAASLRFYQIRAGLKVSPRVPHRLMVTTHDDTGSDIVM